MRRMICAVAMTFLLFDCAKEEFKPSEEENCQVGRFVYTQDAGRDRSLNITYVENTIGKVGTITDATFTSGNWVTNKTYKYTFQNDSIYVRDFSQFKDGEIYIWAQGIARAQTIVTNFPTYGRYRYVFDYSKTNQVVVTLEKMSGNTATFHSRGIYKFEGEDVASLEITRNPDLHVGDPDPFTTRTKTYTYDIIRNPVRNLLLYHFWKPELPDVTYFNSRNRLTEKYDAVTREFKFEYGTDPMPTKQTLPGGIVEKYEYPNCTN